MGLNYLLFWYLNYFQSLQIQAFFLSMRMFRFSATWELLSFLILSNIFHIPILAPNYMMFWIFSIFHSSFWNLFSNTLKRLLYFHRFVVFSFRFVFIFLFFFLPSSSFYLFSILFLTFIFIAEPFGLSRGGWGGGFPISPSPPLTPCLRQCLYLRVLCQEY